MRFPALSDLDREQRRIYGQAPGDGAILIVGPPGTGKTVMAFHRAQKLKALGQEPLVIMYNRVLRRYTSTRGGVAENVPVSTMNKWVEGWWRAATRRWTPKGNGSRYDVDWTSLCSEGLATLANSADKERFGWGHLLVDEGQDFPPSMYMTLGLFQKQLANAGIATQLTVFADDNQRLQVDRNCRVIDIRKNLFIEGAEDRNFVLKKNFRNTRQIARFSSYYQVGNESGVAELPDAEGEVPQVVFASNDRDVADFVLRKTKLNPGKQVGVIVHGGKHLVKRAYNQIKARLGDAKGAIKLQMYLSGDETHSDEKLDFDKPNTITVLHAQSAKGLEFDVVFFVGMERMSLDSSGFYNERMALYVMCSRARSELYVVYTEIDPTGGLPASTALLPKPSYKLCRYVGLGIIQSIMPYLERSLEHNSSLNELEDA
ncbi:hypothetical protein GCM10022276_12990 [Sphingomonas limnosediminicola]|uniref:DNA 3'-5' helicase II n=1 Tax=Sphingomonas limnosediminicola TaxID=940133 RepID=A0ABP7L8Y9_9SPHN